MSDHVLYTRPMALTTGEKLALRRDEKGWNQDVLATILGTTVRTVSRWETNAGPIPLSKQLRLLKMGLLDLDDVDIDVPEVSRWDTLKVAAGEVVAVEAKGSGSSDEIAALRKHIDKRLDKIEKMLKRS